VISILIPLVLLLVGLALGGRPEHLYTLRLRGIWLVLIAFAGQWLLVHTPGVAPMPAIGAAFIASYGLLLGFLLINRRHPGLRLALAGTVLNLAAILANGGFMPITPEVLAAVQPAHPPLAIGQWLPLGKDILLPRAQAHLSDLGDTITILAPIGPAFSIGDLAVATGVGTLILCGMQPRALRRRRAPRPARAAPGPLLIDHAPMEPLIERREKKPDVCPGSTNAPARGAHGPRPRRGPLTGQPHRL